MYMWVRVYAWGTDTTCCAYMARRGRIYLRDGTREPRTKQYIRRLQPDRSLRNWDDRGGMGRAKIRNAYRKAYTKRLRAQTRRTATTSNVDPDEAKCMVCGSLADGAHMLLCDGDGSTPSACTNACHTYCCSPMLIAVPQEEWCCVNCEDTIRLKKRLEYKKEKARLRREHNERKEERAKTRQRRLWVQQNPEVTRL